MSPPFFFSLQLKNLQGMQRPPAAFLGTRIDKQRSSIVFLRLLLHHAHPSAPLLLLLLL
jgi:hypothetical protein